MKVEARMGHGVMSTVPAQNYNEDGCEICTFSSSLKLQPDQKVQLVQQPCGKMKMYA
jgi:hypothetical protein